MELGEGVAAHRGQGLREDAVGGRRCSAGTCSGDTWGAAVSILLHEETGDCDASDFDVERWHAGHGAGWSVGCRFRARCVFLCDSHRDEARRRFFESLAASLHRRCVKCQTRSESFDAQFEAVAL